MKLFYFSGNGGDSVDRLAKKTQKQNQKKGKLYDHWIQQFETNYH